MVGAPATRPVPPFGGVPRRAAGAVRAPASRGEHGAPGGTWRSAGDGRLDAGVGGPGERHGRVPVRGVRHERAARGQGVVGDSGGRPVATLTPTPTPGRLRYWRSPCGRRRSSAR